MKIFSNTANIAFIISVASTLLSICSLLKPNYSVVTFNDKQIARQFVAQLSHQYKSDSKTAEITKRFANALNTSLAEYAKKNHVIVLKESSTLGSGIDKTQAIGALVTKNMRAGQ